MYKRGVTIIELIIASLILIIVILGVMVVFSNSTKLLVNSKDRSIAVRYLNNEIEKFNNITNTDAIQSELQNYSGEGKCIYDANGNLTQYKIAITSVVYDELSISNESAPEIYMLKFKIKGEFGDLEKWFITNPGFN